MVVHEDQWGKVISAPPPRPKKKKKGEGSRNCSMKQDEIDFMFTIGIDMGPSPFLHYFITAFAKSAISRGLASFRYEVKLPKDSVSDVRFRDEILMIKT